MDGIELLAQVQINHPELANMPFVFLTALADKENLTKASLRPSVSSGVSRI